MTAVRRTAAHGGVLLVMTLALAGCLPTPTQIMPPETSAPSTTEPTTESTTEPTETPDDEGPMSENDVSELAQVTTDEVLPGQCIASLSPGLQAGGPLTVVPCADSHHAELITETESDETEFPGAEDLQSSADSWCSDILPAIANGVPEQSQYLAVAPDEERWDEGDRRLLCFLVAYEATYTGSFVGGNGVVHLPED